MYTIKMIIIIALSLLLFLSATSCPALPPLFGGRIRLGLGLDVNTTMMFVNSSLSNFDAFNLIPVGSKAAYECIGGFVLSERATRVCMEGGRWSGVQPVCVKGRAIFV